MSANLLKAKPKIINIGLAQFADTIRQSGAEAIHLDWTPPAQGDLTLNKILLELQDDYDQIEQANSQAIEKVLAAQPVWIDVGPALEMIPGFSENTVLHAGPPISWDQMCGPMKGGVIGGLIYEGRARNKEEALALAGSGRIEFAPNHHFGAVGPMSGIITASMPVIVVENQENGNRAYSNFNSENNRKALSFGAFDQDIQDILNWQRDVMAPMLGAAIRKIGGLDLKGIMARALQMGDECHNRHIASTSLLLKMLLPTLARLDLPGSRLAEFGDYLMQNDWFFLNFSMAACKAAMDAAHGFPHSTLVTAMARNGAQAGIRVSGLGEQWFTAPAPPVRGIMFPPFGEEDANPDMGDSTITETFGLGAFAMAAAPALVQLIGGKVADAIGFTKSMRQITMVENGSFSIPNLDFAGTPTGIDLRAVVETGIHPKINTGIAHRRPGYGIAGAGITEIPLSCFQEALKEFAKHHSARS
ncbi:MAG: DUF1116 domain-containing protein [Firmicutes bacterium]|nr:DUF1116 domain-containing protein [Bacillota bacterium]